MNVDLFPSQLLQDLLIYLLYNKSKVWIAININIFIKNAWSTVQINSNNKLHRIVCPYEKTVYNESKLYAYAILLICSLYCEYAFLFRTQISMI